MKTNHRFLALLVAMFMLVGVLVGCSNNADKPGDEQATAKPAEQTETEPETPSGELIGTGAVKFDPNKNLSGDVTAWFYEDGKRFISTFFEDYQAYRPDVNLEVTYIAWNDYWTKLPVALASNVGPDLFYFHNMHHTLIVEEGLQAPYPEELVEGLKQDFDNIDQYVQPDGNVYYVPTGGGHGMIYYNKDLWAEAGLTEADFPETWEQLHELAKQLTKRENDRLVVSGYNFLPVGAQAGDWVYMSGCFQYSEDGKQSMLNQPEVKKTFEYFLSWIDEGIVNPNFQEAQQSFQDGTSAMIWNHPYFAGVLKANAPDIDFGVFAQPKFEGKARNWHYNNPDVSMGINPKATEEAQEIAVDMLYLFFADDKYLREWDLGQGLSPTKKSLMGDEELASNPIISVQMADFENSVYVGGSVSGYSNVLAQTLLDPIIVGGKTWDDVIETAVEECNKALQASNFRPVERLWNHADELK